MRRAQRTWREAPRQVGWASGFGAASWAAEHCSSAGAGGVVGRHCTLWHMFAVLGLGQGRRGAEAGQAPLEGMHAWLAVHRVVLPPALHHICQLRQPINARAPLCPRPAADLPARVPVAPTPPQQAARPAVPAAAQEAAGGDEEDLLFWDYGVPPAKAAAAAAAPAAVPAVSSRALSLACRLALASREGRGTREAVPLVWSCSWVDAGIPAGPGLRALV